MTDALAIASCINAHPYVKGELCVSDDLTYTTGYFASAKLVTIDYLILNQLIRDMEAE